MANALELDDPSRYGEIHERILAKASLRSLYEDLYGKYRSVLNRCPSDGIAIELGSGAGFTKDRVPEITTTDVIAYPGVEQIVDATQMPFAENSVKFIGLLNTLHHIPNPEAFFREAVRVLKPGGRVFISDQHRGWVSRFVLKYVHHEGYDDRATSWTFPSSGPLSSANGALAWIIFIRDRARFEALFPELRIVAVRPHTPFQYWLSGGLKSWSMLPGGLWKVAKFFDQALLRISSHFGSFLDIELERIQSQGPNVSKR